ncbi:MAG: mobile mystery protein B [Fimbriimonadaceae bacterium]|nr:mobile mystery protein B [Fimbriimonadaceae bacterium]
MNEGLPVGATPIDPAEAEGLIPKLAARAELNEFEAVNIAQTIAWAENSRRMMVRLLEPETLRLLHKRMFDRTWKWAGRYRTTQKNLGVEAYRIGEEIKNLTEDTQLWMQAETYPPTEIAARFHHRLVAIHAYPNGNGRHARLATDLLCMSRGWPMPDWGAASLDEPGEVRARYIDALRKADAHDLQPLCAFLYTLPKDV